MRTFSRAEANGFEIANCAEQAGEKLRQALLIIESIGPAPQLVRPAVAVADAAAVRIILKARRLRSKFFEDSLFADPAWDMLLELYAAQLSQLRVSVTSLCSAAAVPSTTALRWITSLEKHGLISRRADPIDRRRFFVQLSPQGGKAMKAYFDSLPVAPVGL
jgi:DNA-binding MarR family transcriptional regulator